MTEALPVFDVMASQQPRGWNGRASSRADILQLVRSIGGCRTDFVLLLTDDRLHLVQAWRMTRAMSGIEGFPSGKALQLASAAEAAGMIVVQERDDPVPRGPDIALTRHLRDILQETGIELLDHLLISGEAVSPCRAK